MNWAGGVLRGQAASRLRLTALDVVLLPYFGYPNLKSLSRSRETGVYVSIWDEHIDPAVECGNDDRWGVICEAHASVLCTEFLDVAKELQAGPTGFCDGCRELAAAGLRHGLEVPAWAMAAAAEARKTPQYAIFKKVGAARARKVLKRYS